MRIVVVGGNGGTGASVVRQALARGDEVVSISRGGWGVAHEGLTDVKRDATASDQLDAVLAGADAVVIAVGSPGFDRNRVRTRVTASVVASMRRVGVRRVVVHSSLGVGDSLRLMREPVRTLAKVALGVALADHATQEGLVAGSRLDWASVRPGGLTDEALAGDVRLVPTSEAEVGAPTGRISREDVAAGILQVIDDGLAGTFVFVRR